MDSGSDTTRTHHAGSAGRGESTFTIPQRMLVSLIVALICAFTWFVEKLPNRLPDL